jgi:hypothetical protein
MKFIITESQRNRIFEKTIEKKKNWVPILTSLIEKTCEQIELSCSEIDADDFPVDISFDTCEDIEHLERIEIESVDYNESNDGTIPNFTLQIRIYSNSPSFRNFDSLLYELSDRFTKTLGSNVNWKVLDQLNHYKKTGTQH